MESADGDGRVEQSGIRPALKHLVVFTGFVLLIGLPIIYHWASGGAGDDDDQEYRQRQMRREFREANQSPPYRFFQSPALSAGVDVFASGPQDIFRSSMGGTTLSVEDIDMDNQWLVYVSRRNVSQNLQLANLRFCDRLTLMGNPKIEDLEVKLLALKPFEPLSELARPLVETQSSGPFEFSGLRVERSTVQSQLRGEVGNRGRFEPEFVRFYFELFGPERSVGVGEFEVQQLMPGRRQAFEVPFHLRGLEAERWDEVKLKIDLVFTSEDTIRRRPPPSG